MTFRLRLLGRFRLEGPAGKEIAVSARKAQALLAILALSPERRMERDKAIALLWGDRAEEQARGSLRQLLTQLRRQFAVDADSLLLIEGDWLGLSTQAMACDLWDFDAFSKEIDGASLARAEDLWQGELAEGLSLREAAFEDWLADMRRYWRGRRQDFLQARLAQFPDTITRLTAARALLALDPLSESACRALMTHFAEAGERSQALQEYRRCQELLARDLGAEPEAETQALYRRILADDAPAAEPPAKPVAPTSDKPAIAVLPFQNLSGDPEQLYFSDGISEDIVIALSRFHSLTVIARNSSFAFRDGTAALAEIKQALGIDYLLEGSVRRAGNRVRVAAQLIDCAQGDHVWAQRYDRDLEDIFAVQDDLTDAIVSEVGGGIGRERSRRATRMGDGQLRAQDFV